MPHGIIVRQRNTTKVAITKRAVITRTSRTDTIFTRRITLKKPASITLQSMVAVKSKRVGNNGEKRGRVKWLLAYPTALSLLKFQVLSALMLNAGAQSL